jgi:hypothetical protein
MSHRIDRGRRFIVPAVVMATVIASCVSGQGSPPPGVSGEPSSSDPLPVVSPSSTPGPSTAAPVRPDATPPAAGQPWGGLVFTAVTPAGSQERVLGQTEFHGRTYGFRAEALAEGGWKYLLVGQTPDGSWATISSDITGTYGGRLAAGDGVMVAAQWSGETVKCQTDAHGLETCSTGALKVWASSDGESWRAAGTLPGSATLSLSYLTWGPAGFVAGSGTLVDGRHTPVMWTSGDGLTWRKVALSSTLFADAVIDDVVAVRGGYVATGGTGRVIGEMGYMGTLGGAVAAWWSADGEHWAESSVEVPETGAQVLGPILVSDGGLLAHGFLYTDGDAGDGYISAAWTSVDGGRTWRYHATDTFGDDREGFVPEIPVSRYGLLASDGHRLISVKENFFGDVAVGVWESFDGLSWRELKVEGLDYVNGVVGSEWLGAAMRVDDSGVTLSIQVGERSFQVRGWAVP